VTTWCRVVQWSTQHVRQRSKEVIRRTRGRTNPSGGLVHARESLRPYRRKRNVWRCCRIVITNKIKWLSSSTLKFFHLFWPRGMAWWFRKKVQVGKQVLVIKDTFRSDSLNTRNGTDRDGMNTGWFLIFLWHIQWWFTMLISNLKVAVVDSVTDK
jgi:hypothetical protein